MLVLSRKESQRIRLGDSIVVTIVKISGDKVRVGIEALESKIAKDPPSRKRLEDWATVWESCVKLEIGFWDMSMNISYQKAMRQNTQHETRMRNIHPHKKIIAYITHVIWNTIPLRVVGFILDFWLSLAQCPLIDHLYFNVNIPCAFQLDFQTWSRL